MEVTVCAGVAYLCEKADLTLRALGCRHLIVGFELPAAYVVDKGVVFESIAEREIKVDLGVGYDVGDLRFDLYRCVEIEEGAQTEHVALDLTFA